jgi:predicted phosphate transport protein (TIGR00153 family)
MSTIGKLFGRSPFSQIQQHMDQVNKCVDKMSESLEPVKDGNFEQLDGIADEVLHLEHQADQIKDDIREKLLKRFFMPIDRSEVLEIVSLQDSIADTAEDICKVLTIRKLPFPEDITDDYGAFVDLNRKACRTCVLIISMMAELIESVFRCTQTEHVRSLAKDSALTEHQADVVQMMLLKKICAHDEDFTVDEFHLWMRVTRNLSRLSNIAENLADRILDPDYSRGARRRNGESLFGWGIVSSLRFRQFTHDVKLRNLQNLSPLQANRFKGQTRRLTS